jgi:carbonic anhydrase/acetyltransferase-like protein (isoleucine patch superfamily)
MLRPHKGITPRVHATAFVDVSAQVIGDVEIGDDVTIGHGAIVHGCTLRGRILVGMGAILLNGVDVAEDCIIAAGTLPTEGMSVPSRSLVMGSPGKVRRQLSDEEVESIRWYSERYVGYRLDYMAGVSAGPAR